MAFYKNDDIEQGSASWHTWRSKVLGASDAKIVMGERRFLGKQTLIQEKIGVITPFRGNAFTREGHKLEKLARNELSELYGEVISPAIVQDSKIPYLAASLDGITPNGGEVFEIKCGAADYERINNAKKIPSYHYAQIQHILMVTQHENMVFAAFRPNSKLIVIRVERDESYIKELRKKEIEFVQELIKKGHEIQKDFKGKKIFPEKLNSRKIKSSERKQVWEYIDGSLHFYDGNKHFTGTSEGNYLLGGKEYFWDGSNWIV